MKKIFLFLIYAWLRFDPIIRLAFGKSWTPRYEFMASLFGEADTESFLEHRVKLVKARDRKAAPYILPSNIDEEITKFLKINQDTKTGLKKRKQIIKKLISWAIDPDINAQNIESYKTRSEIAKSLLGVIFQNSLADESELILSGIKKIVFSRITYLGSKGEPSPIVHNTIIAGVGRVLNTHFSEVVRLRNEKLEDLTKIKIIKEIKNDEKGTGSLAFSGTHRKDDPYRHKFPLAQKKARMLISILKHYQYSAWPESRETAIELIKMMESKLGFDLEENSQKEESQA
jgi:hypothetical protein